MPARRKRKLKLNLLNLPYKWISVVLLTIFFVFTFQKTKTRLWHSNERLVIVYPTSTGLVEVSVLDPVTNKIVDLSLPGNTEIHLARNLGEWKVSSVWELGENEGLDGQLLADSITKSLKLPVDGWIDTSGEDLVKGNIFDSFKSLFLTRKTNLSFGDRLRIFIFILNVKPSQRTSLDLAESLWLKPSFSADGEEIYKLQRDAPSYVLAEFSLRSIGLNDTLILIKDATNKGKGQEIGEILETMGLKVTAVERSDGLLVKDCNLQGGKEANLTVVKKVANVFNCNYEIDSSQETLTISLGEDFAKRF